MSVKNFKPFWLWVVALFVCSVLALSLSLSWARHQNVQLADGRVIEIEGVTFGLDHHIGSRFALGTALSERLKIDFRSFRFHRETHSRWPALVVWLNAVTNVTGGAGDTGEILVELVDKQGVRYGGLCYCGGGGGGFKWAGYCFEVYPRAERDISLEITPFYTNQATKIEIRNPHRVTPARWTGGPLPQAKSMGDLQVSITGMRLRTNGTALDLWSTPTRYWEPAWELRRKGKPATGWDTPEWTAEDQVGNRSRIIPFNQPVLRFYATCYPNVTNVEDTVIIGRSPPIALKTLSTNTWSHAQFAVGNQKISVVGFFPAGDNMFIDGQHVTNAPPWVHVSSDIDRSVMWQGGSRSSGTFGQIQRWQMHRTVLPTLYLLAPELPSGTRMAVRIQDERGRWWPTTVQNQEPGEPRAYFVDVPPEAETVTAEIVLLKPVEAQFLVNTPVQGETNGNLLRHE